MNKPTPGPWQVSGTEIWAGSRRITMGSGAFDERDRATRDANAALIIAAVNACFIINPDNPQAVAEALPELVEVLNNLVTVHQTGLIYPPLKVRAESWDKARAALAKLDAKS